MWFPNCRTQHTQRKACNQKTKIRNSRKTQPILSLRTLRFSCVCVAYVAVFLICVAWPTCVASIELHTAARKLSVFIGLHAVSKFLYATHATQSSHVWLAMQSKTEIRNACTQKTQCTESNRFYSLRVLRFLAFFMCMRCIRQLGNRPSSPFSAFQRQQLCFNIRHV